MNPSNTQPMKRQRSTSEVTRISDTEAIDRLSDLPDDIILEIFSSLTTETTIATSVLSKRWKGLWKEMRSLKFDNKLHPHNFSDNVIRALLSYEHSTIQSLTIGVKKKCDPVDLTIWVAIAFAKHVSKLVLRLDDFSNNIAFPDGALARSNTLKILKLMGPFHLHLRLPNVSLNCLKELHLHHVRFQNGNSVTHLLKGCSALEVLVMVIRETSGILNITVSVPSLLKLTLAVHNAIDENFVIQTPRLEYLEIQKFEGVDSFIMDNAPKLSVAKISSHNRVMLDNILDVIPSVEHLSLSAPLKYPAGKTYHGLKTLEVHTNAEEWCSLLTYMLICSPNLETLKICGEWFRYWGAKWQHPHYIPLSIASRLHTLVWTSYICDEPDDRDIAFFILKNASQLRNATFTVYKTSNMLRQRRRNEVLTTLSNVARASPSCQLVFKDYKQHEINNSLVGDPDVLDFSY